jgi:ubiquinone/menaquinone biosynthesis C-methylase UbiE
MSSDNERLAYNIEKLYVHDTYESIAQQFDASRFALWDEVVHFLDSFDAKSIILDVGCGNGKYITHRLHDCTVVACDSSASLLHIAKTNTSNRSTKSYNAEFVCASGLKLPYKNNAYDIVISIAVLHHIASHERRAQFVYELIRCVRVGGQVCITVWADEQQKKNKWQRIHDDDTDYYVPFDKRNGEVIMRYYHFFTKKEFVELISLFHKHIHIKRMVYDHDNWTCVLIKKDDF